MQEGVAMEMDWPSDLLEGIVAEYSHIDELELRRSAYQYARTRNKSHSRELFRILRAAAEKQRYLNEG